MSAFRRRGLLLPVMLLTVLAGCGRDARPDAATWATRWESVLAVVPDEAELGSPPDETLCRATLASLREQSTDLFPAPSNGVTELANEWMSVAEAAFFDCPPEGEEVTSFQDVYRELERIQDSIDTALANVG